MNMSDRMAKAAKSASQPQTLNKVQTRKALPQAPQLLNKIPVPKRVKTAPLQTTLPKARRIRRPNPRNIA